MKHKLLIVLGFIGIALGAFADEVVFRAQAPKQVIVGRPFQITYTVNQRSRDLRAPEFTDFDVLSGPYTSTSSSTSFVNGKRTSSFDCLQYQHQPPPEREHYPQQYSRSASSALPYTVPNGRSSTTLRG